MKEQALIELLMMEREFSLEKKAYGYADQSTWERYNEALDEVCKIMQIDPVDFADALEKAMKGVE